MSTRLQVLLDDAEYREIRKIAKASGMTVSQWVRTAITAMRRAEPIYDTRHKLAAVREAASHSYPTADIDQINAEISRGYGSSES
jgi:16S rRNA U516 pseudouridylate synthase RsuA-like enzyme